MPIRSYHDVPRLGALYARTVRAALQPHEHDSNSDELRLEVPRLTIDPGHLAAYCDVTGFPAASAYLPVTYPHVLAFPLHLDLMSDATFPFRPMGLVHVGNTITQHRPIPADATVAIEVAAGEKRPHSKGTVFEVVTDVLVDGEPVWTGTTTLLSRGHGSEGAPADLLPDPEVPPVAQWRLEANLGRRYAAASGDRNPIHLFKLTAQAFGFPRQIAHGMWAKAAALSELRDVLPDAYTVRVDFRKPLLLPSTADFGYRIGDDDHIDLAIHNPRTGEPHLIGLVTAQTP
jgi:acyl dehydratase